MADELKPTGWLYANSVFPNHQHYKHGPHRPDERASWTPLYTAPALPAPAPANAPRRVKPVPAAADAFWRYWRANGETHKHGYYESTWGAINAALLASDQEKS